MVSPADELLNQPPVLPLGYHRRKMDQLLGYFADRGDVPLRTLAGPRYLDRKVDTLKRYVRRLGIAFPDYSPKRRVS